MSDLNSFSISLILCFLIYKRREHQKELQTLEGQACVLLNPTIMVEMFKEGPFNLKFDLGVNARDSRYQSEY
jgi:hypothetical protein